ncbi:MAG: hypothetical protein L3J28_09785 [Candidatus Polarisedimenticolaceae bacterium]|nr:hypothetical protein [Candidatus Polarisedimenticolaceae bacterium]
MLASIETLRERCAQSHQSECDKVREAADRYSASQIQAFDGLNKARMGLANTFIYLMQGGQSYFDKGKVLLDQISSLGSDDKSHYGFMAACITFDWLYNDLSQSDRDRYVADIVNYARSSQGYSNYNSFDAYYSARKDPSRILAFSGQAIFNEDPVNGTEFINRSITALNRIMPIQNEIAKDGFIYPIGEASYFDETGWQPILRILAGLKLAGVSGPEIDAIDYSSISNTAYGEIYSLVKNNHLISHNNGHNNGDKPWRLARGPDGPFYSAILSKLHEGEEIGRITNYLQSTYTRPNISEFPFTFLGSILFNDKTANAVGSTIHNLPLTKVFDDSVLVYRSGWDGLSTENTEVIFNFMAEKHVNSHTAYAKGHFDIWRGYDPLTFTSGDYSNTSWSHIYYYTNSLAANNMLIRNPNENTGIMPNDGGQLTNRGEGDLLEIHNSDAWRELGHTEEGALTYTGSIKNNSFGADYFYAYYHYPSAYSSSKVNDISRSVVRLGGYFVILDRIDGTNASFEKKWLLHSIGTPTILDSGAWNGGTARDANGGTPNQTSSNTKLLKVSEGNSALFVKSIYPTNTIVHRVGGSSDYRWYSYNEDRNYSQGAPTHGNYGNWRIEIESNMGTEDDIFLTLLHPTSSDGTIAPSRGLSGSNYVGVQINDATDATVKVAIFSNSVNESTKESNYSFQIDSTQNVQYIIGDLDAGVYEIRRNGVIVTSNALVTTDRSSLFFGTVSGGTVSVSRRADGSYAVPETHELNLGN